MRPTVGGSGPCLLAFQSSPTPALSSITSTKRAQGRGVLLAFPSHLLPSARASRRLLSSRNGHEEPRYHTAAEGVPRDSGVVLQLPLNSWRGLCAPGSTSVQKGASSSPVRKLLGKAACLCALNPVRSSSSQGRALPI